MRELQCRDEIADGADRRHVGLAVGIDLDEAALHLEPDLLVAEVLRHRPAADRDQQQLRLDGLAALEMDTYAGVGVLDPLEARVELLLDAALAEGPLQQLR